MKVQTVMKVFDTHQKRQRAMRLDANMFEMIGAVKVNVTHNTVLVTTPNTHTIFMYVTCDSNISGLRFSKVFLDDLDDNLGYKEEHKEEFVMYAKCSILPSLRVLPCVVFTYKDHDYYISAEVVDNAGGKKAFVSRIESELTLMQRSNLVLSKNGEIMKCRCYNTDYVVNERFVLTEKKVFQLFNTCS